MGAFINKNKAVEKLGKTLGILEEAYGEYDDYVKGFSHAMRCIDSVETEDTVTAAHGKWVTSLWDAYYFRCSVCGGQAGTKWPYCHHCGAKMEVDTE